ncbi:pilus assembly protein [Trinickia terrae]|uniref:Pilus assembly protein n=1 Tax=Trinickia terrae TaxID=2571161 RepID=A0A4U1I7G6_9BURK|nr:pilus assembly protein [Trinickia terrae]
MRSWKPYVLAFAAVVCSVTAFAAHAAIVITGTRVIYPAQSREVNVRLNNVDDRPVLVQAWIDDGNPAAAPNEIKVPFMLLPSVFRVEPHKGQSLRVMFTGADMPKDRESVYWLNVLEIPPKPSDADQRNMIQLAFRTRIKLFYRPQVLTDDPTSVREQLRWELVSNDKGERSLRVENPSPYYVSVGEASVSSGNKKIDLTPDMAPPFGHIDLFPAKGNLDVKTPVTVSYALVNDYGALAKGTVQIGEGGAAAKSAAEAGKVSPSMNNPVQEGGARSDAKSPGGTDNAQASVNDVAQVGKAVDAKDAAQNGDVAAQK